MKVEKILNFIDKQIRCYDRKIKNITKIKKEEKRCLSERERRDLKYIIGKKDECLKIKQYINNLVEKVRE